MAPHSDMTDLLDSNADSDWVDGALNQNFLFVVTADDHGLEKQLFTAPKNVTNAQVAICSSAFNQPLRGLI